MTTKAVPHWQMLHVGGFRVVSYQVVRQRRRIAVFSRWTSIAGAFVPLLGVVGIGAIGLAILASSVLSLVFGGLCFGAAGFVLLLAEHERAERLAQWSKITPSSKHEIR
jgi:hypothetical protein